jgi:hypothetical protein
MSVVPVQLWASRAQSRRRCGRDEPRPSGEGHTDDGESKFARPFSGDSSSSAGADGDSGMGGAAVSSCNVRRTAFNKPQRSV